MLLSLLVLRYELSAHVGRPVIGGRGHLAPKSSLELARVEHFNKGRWCTVSREHDLLLRFLIDKGLDTFVKESLAPAHMCVERAEEEVHEVGLAQVAEGQDLLPRQRGGRHVIQVANGDPLLALTW